MKSQMNAVEILENQHREVESFFKKFEKAEGKPDEAQEIFEQIKVRLELHTMLEEKVFYPEGRKVDEDMTLEAFEEHHLVDDLLAKISNTDPSDESYNAKVCVLKELIEHHVKEEEEEYFPECEKKLGAEALEEMGAHMQALQEKWIANRDKSHGSKGQTVEKDSKKPLPKDAGAKADRQGGTAAA